LRGAWLRKLESRCYYSRYFERGLRELDGVLYGDEGAPPVEVSGVVSTTEINDPATARLLESLQPDVLLVAGAPILKPHVFGVARVAAINVHFGAAPQYRGEHTLFWPMYFRDEANLGVTIHLIDKGIDTGRALAQGFVSVEPEDDEWSIEAKAARLAADLTIQILEGEQFEPCEQLPTTSRGRVFNSRERRIWHDALLALRRRWFRQRPRAMPRRELNFCIRRPSTTERGTTQRSIGSDAV
jgi:hypothetical protein